MNRPEVLRLAFRRRALVDQVSARIQTAADLIAGSTGMDNETAVKAVFDDQDLLAQVHDVGQLLVPEMPVSQVDVQNNVRGVVSKVENKPVAPPPVRLNPVTGMPV